jgi:3-deoxy-manno-octulosonate cytidylyltransferase (CMP-KDO synthetase)
MAASRFPGKPLADINGSPMIVHVLRRAQAAGIGKVLVATDTPAIVAAVTVAGGQAVLTRADHASGSDRIFEAASIVDPKGRAQVVVNLQGDLPDIAPEAIRAVLTPLADPAVDISTIAAAIGNERQLIDPNIVKVGGDKVGPRHLRARYFVRGAPPTSEAGPYHHIGLYAFRRAVLEAFVKLSPSASEQRERLEQLRAIDAGMRIDVALVDAIPVSVDTPADLDEARKVLRVSRPDLP